MSAHRDLLKHHVIANDTCLRDSPFETYCGLSASHPANMGIVAYRFEDRVEAIEGRAVQTSIAGVCLDDACIRTAPVAIHRRPPGAAGGGVDCTYQLLPTGELSSLVAALTTVEEVRLAGVAASVADAFFVYGPVVRSADADWTATGFKNVVKDFPSTIPYACCDVAALPVAPLPSDRANHTRKGGPSGSFHTTGVAGAAPPSTTLPEVCKLCGAPAPGDGQAPPAGPSPFAYLPAVDTNTGGVVSTRCSHLGDALRQAAAALTSDMDGAATGVLLHPYLDPPPERVDTTNLALVLVAAAHGLATAYVLLFESSEEVEARLHRRMVYCASSLRAAAAALVALSAGLRSTAAAVGARLWGRPDAAVPAPAPAALVAEGQEAAPMEERRLWLVCLRRLLLLLLALAVACVEGVPLLFAALSERAAADWVGIYSHVDLVVINPGPESAAAPPPSPVGGTPPPALPCAAGVTFALTSVLGRARYTTTRASLLSHFFVGAAVALATMLVARPFRWWLAARAAAGADGEGALDGQRLPLRGGADEPPPLEQAAAVA